jgi:hypothetical protein
MAQWAVVIAGEQYRAERLYHHDSVEIGGLPPAPGAVPGPAADDEVLVVADCPEPSVVALGRVRHPGDGAQPLVVAYTRRCFDEPVPVGELALAGALVPVAPAAFRAAAGRVSPSPARRTWLVSLDLPIEAESAAEAVRRFWSYVRELGPRELPAFVSPSGDELAMQAFVLGEQANLDPEDDDD